MQILSPQRFHLIAYVIVFFLFSSQFSGVSGGAVCKNWCANNPKPWIADPGQNQKCDWKACGGCPECPITLYECPETPNDPPFTLPSGELVKLYNADRGRLCTLTRNSIDGSSVKSISPVARSYELNPWESTAGDYAKLTFSCKNYYCLVEIPPIDDDSTDVFQLTAFDISDREMDNSEMISRFLEQATFGATRNEINSWDSVNPLESTFPHWISDQMTHKSPTLHREYFRSRANTRVLETINIGQPLHPCDTNSRWSLYSISKKDRGKNIDVSQLTDANGAISYLFSIDGVPRTEVTNIEVSGSVPLSVPGSYKICNLNEKTGSQMIIKVGSKCEKLLIGNPPIYFSSTSGVVPTNIFSFDSKDNFVVLDPNKQDDEFLRTTAIDNDPQCGFLHINNAFPSFAKFPNTDDWLLYDPRLVLDDNTPASPIIDGGGSVELNGATCANVPKTFLNIDSCRLSNELSACGAFEFQDAVITLNNSTIKKLYQLTRKYIYAVEGLRPDISPCVPSTKSRWRKLDVAECPAVPSLDTETIKTISDLLKASSSTNPLLRDIQMTANPLCDIGSTSPVNDQGIKIIIDNDCWENVHHHHHNVYDMTYWTKATTHPGNQVAAANNRPNPIKAFAKNGEAFLIYPDWHPIERWNINEPSFTLIGKYDDEVHFQDLPEYIRLESVAAEFGASGSSQSGQGTVICGSPGEVSNDLTLGDRYDMPLILDNDMNGFEITEQRKNVWTNVVLNAPDQLRQRMAWALSQILTMTPETTRSTRSNEPFLNYYDIFVRHAFGNYRDVLKEVSYSPMMGAMLSYLKSKSTSYNFETVGSILYPDENFAREIMQLFTIGTVKLAMDGTPIFNNGTIVQVYDNDDIMTYARAWTGFTTQSRRGNIEDMSSVNDIDPMKIVGDWRDIFPKTNLFGGYVGDGYPLCADLPSYSFLRKGATYRLLGSSPYPELQDDSFTHDDSTLRLTLVPGQSELYKALCRPTTPGGDDCRFQSQIVLDRDLPCGSNGVECAIDIPRVVQVNEHTFYEYVHIPCVELSFYNDAKKISGHRQHYAMCGNPKLPHASEACCSVEDDKAYRNCEFIGERLTYNTASMRCQDIGKESCHFRKIDDLNSNVCNAVSKYYWNDAPCDISIKVDHDGQIAIVHEPEGIAEDDVISRVRRNSPSYFGVHWKNNTFPKSSDNCGIGDFTLCEVINDGCFCKTEVVEERIFSGWNDLPRTVEDLLSLVSIGSRPPDTFDEGTFNPPRNRANAIMVHYRVGQYMDEDTIFEVTVHGHKKYYRNVQSTVFVRGTPTTTFSFRNPPHFMSFVDRDERDAHYETDAVLDDYFHHSNTAPFLAIRFIQRFGISNPSPRFVKSVATAFVEGYYGWNGTQFEFGTGEYGDLGSTVAAILLDPESRSAVLDMDPTHGSLKEPLLKVFGLMRSMEFQRNLVMPEVRLEGVMNSIGQMAHEIPTVFSFFLPEYAPPGPVSSASLVAPEAQLLQMPKVVGLLNGVFSMVKYGLSECYGGWGQSTAGRCDKFSDEGNYGKSLGMLTFSPYGNDPHEVVNELGMLLTAGRLSTESRRIIESAYNSANDKVAGLRLAQQLILSTAEFHSTNLVEKSGETRDVAVDRSLPTSAPASSTDASYKAIVFLLLEGGCDSYNMLVPHSNCQQQKNMYQEYLDVRGDIALSNVTDNIIDASGSAQVCDNFFLHPNLPYLKTLYDQKDALFFANTGVLTEPVTKEDWNYKTQTQLFAHNFQQQETQRIDPLSEAKGTGVLGRMTDVMTQKGYKTGSVSISADTYALVGTDGVSPPINFISQDGVTKFNENPSMVNMSLTIKDLNNATTSTSGLFAETWSNALYTSIDQNKALSQAIDNAVINTDFPGTSLGNQLEIVSRMIKAHGERGTQRDVFYVTMGGFDTHSEMGPRLVDNFRAINDVIESFALEMDHQNEWDNVVMLEASDFGRTLTSNNGDGSDHGWGGNYFMIGGGIDGGRILGNYPNDLTDSGSQSIKRGRLIPTTSWDEVWNGIGEWFGVTDEGDLDKVLPNREKFNGLMGRDDLFVQSIAESRRRKYLRR